MWKISWLAILLMFLPVVAHAQDTTTRVVRLLPDTTQARIDSLTRIAQRKRERARCESRESITLGAAFGVAGGVVGATLAAIPATTLSLTKHHDAARSTFWTMTAGGAISFGTLGMLVGVASCN